MKLLQYSFANEREIMTLACWLGLCYIHYSHKQVLSMGLFKNQAWGDLHDISQDY